MKTIFYIFLVLPLAAMACPENQVCKRIIIDVDLYSKMLIGETAPQEMCQEAAACGPASKFASSETVNNCSLSLYFSNGEGRPMEVGVKSVKAHRFITGRFTNADGFGARTGMYTLRPKTLIDDVYACVPEPNLSAGVIEATPVQKPIHCLGKSSISDSSSVSNEFVDRTSVCSRAPLATLELPEVGECSIAKEAARAKLNQNLRSFAMQVANQASSGKLNLSTSTNLGTLAAGMAAANQELAIQGIGLVLAAKNYQADINSYKTMCSRPVWPN